MKSRRFSRAFDLRQTLVWACFVGFGFGVFASPCFARLDRDDQQTRLVGTVLDQAALPAESIGQFDREASKPGQPNAVCAFNPHRGLDRLPFGNNSLSRSGQAWHGRTSLTTLGVRLQI